MATPISQKEYLKKYLSGPKKDKNKKKSKKKGALSSKSRTQIIDDDVSLRKLDELGQVSEEEFGEDAPQVAEIIDERPVHMQGRWKKLEVGDDQTFHSTLSSVMIDNDFVSSTLSLRDKNGASLSGNQEALGADNDLSPPRLKNRHDSDDDISPPRSRLRHDNARSTRNPVRERHDSNSDISPPRSRKRQGSDLASPRTKKTDVMPLASRSRHDSSSDTSPPRHRKRNNSDLSPPRSKNATLLPSSYRRHDSSSDRKKRHDSKDDQLLRDKKAQDFTKKRCDSSSDTSPPRRKIEHHSNRLFVSAKKKHSSRKGRGSSSDQSPPRSRNRHDLDRNRFSHDERSNTSKRTIADCLPSRNTDVRRHDSDSDVSPPRIGRKKDHPAVRTVSSDVRRRNDSDRYKEQRNANYSRTRHDTDDETSPERHKKEQTLSKLVEKRREAMPMSSRGRMESQISVSPRKKQDLKSDSDSNSSDHSRKKDSRTKAVARPSETLTGLRAGLQNATTLRTELQLAKEREKELLKDMGSDMGKGTETVFRDRATGKKRDLKEERRQKRKEAEKLAEQQEKYLEWGRGVKQTAEKQNQLEQDLYEMSKPLARYQDDPDLEKHLKDQEREGDPMLEFIRKRKLKESPEQVRPKYKGPPAPPNRFGIEPGYRWDGVDRSNGFEKKVFERKSNKIANQDDAYKWSVADM